MLTTFARGTMLILNFRHGLKHATHIFLIVLCEPQAATQVPALFKTVLIAGGGDNTNQHSGNLSRHKTEIWWQCWRWQRSVSSWIRLPIVGSWVGRDRLGWRKSDFTVSAVSKDVTAAARTLALILGAPPREITAMELFCNKWFLSIMVNLKTLLRYIDGNDFILRTAQRVSRLSVTVETIFAVFRHPNLQWKMLR